MKQRIRRLAAWVLTLLMTAAGFPITAPAAASADGAGGIIMTGNDRSALFNDGWRFAIGTHTGAEAPAFDDGGWREVDLPHDWLIGQIRDLYKSDIGWYRKTFYLPEAQRGQNVAVQFDGVYMDTTVYVNGQKAGEWPYGYTSFQFDITRFLHFGNTPNVIAVRVNHQSPNTRWYSGAGIYRNVWLTVTDPVHVAWGGTYVSTDGGAVTVETEVVNTADGAVSATVVQTVLNGAGQAVASGRGTAVSIPPGETRKDLQTLTVSDPTLWDVENPYLYTVRTQVEIGGGVRDTYTTPFGFRTVRIDAQQGFFLNGRYMKLHGVDMHHDLGALGSAVNTRALERQLEILQGMGVNALRTSHNPPAPELLALCDRMGMLVIDEAFDMWNDAKSSNDYHRFFAQWSERDTRAWIRRDRNHPSVIMWSIGNEVTDTKRADGVATARRLIGYIDGEDSRKNALRTIGSNYMADANAIEIGRLLDAAGYNYIENLYDEHHVKYPDMGLYASESASAVRSRGVYHLPADQNILRHFDQQCSSYDNSWVEWGASAEEAWKWDRDRPYVLGEFVWTGFDYIGEPIPYSTKNAYFGIVDTAGIPKDIYYFYQSVWTEQPMVHLLPHWDWDEGAVIPVWAYSNADSVELFLDGVSLGRRRVDLTGDVLHSEWQVPFRAGTLTAKAYNAQGTVVATDSVTSCGDGAGLRLTPDRASITADGKDLVFIEASVLDAQGVFVANARNRVSFTVTGGGRLVGLDNGDSTDYEPYQATARRAFSGKLMAIVQSDGSGGAITVTARSPGMPDVSVTVQAAHTRAVTGVALASIDGSDAVAANRGTLKLQAAVTPADADYRRVAYSVENTDGTATDRAVIDQNGVLTAYKNGAVRVVATALDGSGQSAAMTVSITGQSAFTAVSGITVGGAAGISTLCGGAAMTAAVTPANAAARGVRWSVRNRSGAGAPCADIDASGMLRARYDGVVVVRAEAADGSGVYGEREVTVSGQLSRSVPVRRVTLELVQGSRSLAGLTGRAKVKATVYPADADVGALEWSVLAEDGVGISNVAKLTVGGDGTVTVAGRFNGAFWLCAAAKNGSSWAQAWGTMAFTVSGLTERTMYPYTEIKARDYSFGSKEFGLEGAVADRSVGSIRGGDWVGFRAVDFGENPSVKLRLTGGRADAGSAAIELRDGAPDGALLATLQFDRVSGSWTELGTQVYALAGLTGVHDLYFVFTNGGFLFNGFVFEGVYPPAPPAPPEPDYTLGDVDDDGVVDSTDARLVLQHEVALLELTERQMLAADVDGSWTVDSTDARMILQYEVGLLPGFPAA